MLSLWLALGGLVGAQAQSEPTRVFVSELQPENKEAGGFASLMTGYLAGELGAADELSVVTAYEAPNFGETTAVDYLLSCPPGEALGCAYVVGDRVDASYAVTGSVAALPEGNAVHVSIIDVSDSREAVAFDVLLAVGDDQRFTKLVKDMLLAVIVGEEGALSDEREFGADTREAEAKQREDVARQLAALAGEMGDVSELSARGERQIQRPEYTVDDLGKEAASDATPPWELMGMTPNEFLKFKNSGMSVSQWRKATAGRRGQLLIHAGGGVMRGGLDTQYEGWYAIDPTTQQNLQGQAWQSRTLSTGPVGMGWVGYGLNPFVEVDVGFGLAAGRYDIHIQQEIVGEDVIPRDGQDFPQQNLLLGARVLGALMPNWRARPQVGVGFVYVLGEGTAQNLLPASGTGLPSFASSNYGMAQIRLGVETSLSPRLDIWVALPVSVLVVGGQTQVFDNGQPGSIRSYEAPPQVPSLTTGVELGVMVRALGKVDEVERDFDLPD